ncbi:MAG: SIR2 family protein [Bacteroides sp.]|nr:SIR2 family protein [Bacteroides sp.]
MKIFISYNSSDKVCFSLIKDTLEKLGHEVIPGNSRFKAGDNIFNKIIDEILGCDLILILINQKTLSSKMDLMEIEAILLNDIAGEKGKIVLIKTGECSIPGYLMNYRLVDFYDRPEAGMEELVSLLSVTKNEKQKSEPKKKVEETGRDKNAIERLKQELKSGNLTLICGAGVSVGADIPSWNELLFELLQRMIAKIADENLSVKPLQHTDYNPLLSYSSLIVGRYLKTNLGKDFLTELRNALYKKDPRSCDLIEAIVELSRPQRDGAPLNSIITFNFDDLIEVNLGKHNIKYKVIDNEEVRHKSNELPIYHVHGYLPRTGKIAPTKNIVFSEDTYHTQFIEPFSWSNLIQLNKLSQNTCLLIGLSMTDPNLRRLLDVASRKNPSHELNHFIIKKIPEVKDGSAQIHELIKFLEEQDAKELGLNVIWVKDFDEIGSFLRKLL